MPLQTPPMKVSFPYLGMTPKEEHAARLKARKHVLALKQGDIEPVMRELRFARKTIRRMKWETNEFEYAREVANKALRRLDAFIRGGE